MNVQVRLTQEPSVIDRIRGAYGEIGIEDFCEGHPNPDIPFLRQHEYSRGLEGPERQSNGVI